MRIMKCILISFIVINLTFQGFLRSVFAANTTHNPLKHPELTKFALKVKPLTINEQVFLKTIEVKTHSLLNQAAGAFYDKKYERRQQFLREGNPNSFSPGHVLIGSAMIGAFFGFLASSGDTGSIKKSVWTGALIGVVTVSLLYYVF